MKKAVVIIGSVVVALIVLFAISYSKNGDDRDDQVFHITLADPTIYKNGIYSENFLISPGKYSFDFVPNGDSPETLSIQLLGDSFSFDEDFSLNGTLHKTGISEYYTWDYGGQKQFEISATEQELLIKIDPNGDVMGPVSVEIIELVE